MSTVKSEYKYIEIRDDGVPIIAGTTTKVVDIIKEKVFWDWNPEQIHKQHPYLSLAQIYSAFVYYADHEVEINNDIDERRKQVEELQKQIPDHPVVKKLRDEGKL